MLPTVYHPYTVWSCSVIGCRIGSFSRLPDWCMKSLCPERRVKEGDTGGVWIDGAANPEEILMLQRINQMQFPEPERGWKLYAENS